MAALIVSVVLAGAAAWLAAGFAVALWLHSGRLAKMDPGTVGAGIGFRVLVTPGMMALWPWLLRNWRRARRGENPLPDPDRPVPARALRVRHGLYVRAMAVVVPIACAAAIIARPAPVVNATALPEPLRTGALPRVVEASHPMVPGHAVALAIRSDERGRAFQLELDVAERLTLHEPMVYWMPRGSAQAASEYVGSIAGEGVHRFAISERMAREGTFAVISFRDATALGATLPEGS